MAPADDAAGHSGARGARQRLGRTSDGTTKEEEVGRADYEDFANAQAQIGRCIDDVYQMSRIHSALGYLTQAAFEAGWVQEHR